MGKVFKAITKTTPAENRKGARARLVPESVETISDENGSASARSVPESKRSVVVRKRKTEPVLDKISALDDKLIAVNDSFSPVAESFRHLRTKLLHPQAGKAAPRSILVTSVAPNEGKGFIAANLAVTMAQGVEQHALLVDCDLRRPSLAALFGLTNEEGLADHLQDGADLSLFIRKTDIPKLSILPAGPPPDNPSELLDSEKMVMAIAELMSRYRDRFVIFDSPPMQAASETAVLAQHVDGIVLVVRWGGAGRAQVKKLAELVGKDKIAGVVFNGVQGNEIENRLYRYKGYHEYDGAYRA